jgi:hypothetical protein
MRGFGGSEYNNTQPPRGNPYNQQQGGGRGRFGGGGRDGGRNYGGGGRGGNNQQQGSSNPFSTAKGNQQQQPRGFPASQQGAAVAVNPFSSNQPQPVSSFQSNSNQLMSKPPSGAVKVAANPFAAGTASSQKVFTSGSNVFANTTPQIQQQPQQPSFSSSPFSSQQQQQPSFSNNPFSSGNNSNFPSVQNQQQTFHPPRPLNPSNNPFQKGYQPQVSSATANPFTSGGSSFPPKAPQVSSNNPFVSSSSQPATASISTEKVKSEIKNLDFKSVLANKTTDFQFDVPPEVPGSTSGMIEGDSMKDDNNTSVKEREDESVPASEASEILQTNEEQTSFGNEHIIDDGLIRWMDNFPLKEYLNASDELINPFKYLDGQLVPGRIPAAVP